jgi:hypothetical protein
VRVGDRQVGVADHGVGPHDLAAGQPDALHRPRGPLGQQDAPDRGAVAQPGPGLGGRRRQGLRQGVHAARACDHPVHHVHVRDDRVEGQRLVGGQAGVEGLEAEDAAQPLVREPAGDGPPQAPESAHAHQVEGRAQGPDEVEGAVVVRLDEVGHLDPVQAAQPVAERSNAAASPGPHTRRTSSAIASRPCRTRTSLPSAYTARYIGSTGTRVSRSPISTPAAWKQRSTRSGRVSTVGPVSNR